MASNRITERLTGTKTGVAQRRKGVMPDGSKYEVVRKTDEAGRKASSAYKLNNKVNALKSKERSKSGMKIKSEVLKADAALSNKPGSVRIYKKTHGAKAKYKKQ